MDNNTQTVLVTPNQQQILCMASFLQERQPLMQKWFSDRGVFADDVRYLYDTLVAPVTNGQITAVTQPLRMRMDVHGALLEYFCAQTDDIDKHFAAWGMSEDSKEREDFMQAWEL